MEAVLVLSLLTAGGVRGGSRVVRSPQQITQEVLLTPFHLVRNTGNTAFQTGQQLVHSVPEALNDVSDAAVSGVDSVPHTVNAVSDLTVDTINSVPNTFNAITNLGVAGIRDAPANTVRVISQTPGQVVNLGNSAFNTVGQVPFTAFRFTGNALRAGATALTRTPAAFSTAVNSGTGFVRAVPQSIVSAPGTVFSAGSSGLRTVANDGVNMITSIPSNAIQLTGTAFRTGEALVNGGTRLMLATGNSLLRTGVNTVTGGGRVLFATAGMPLQLASDAMQRIRQLF